MADKPLFDLDAEGRWRLAYDRQQWIIQRRKGSARPSNRSGIAESGWRGVFPFVGGKKTTLARLFREKGISLTPEENDVLKRLSRRRRRLVDERGRVISAMQADLQAVAPGLSQITRCERPAIRLPPHCKASRAIPDLSRVRLLVTARRAA